MKNIVLCGFMGCGKTTVGKELSRLIGSEFIDMDAYIESEAGRRIDEIFLQSGEAEFRAIESDAAKKLSQQQGLVISAGGGAVLRPENVSAFKEGGLIVFIDVPLDVIKKRLIGDTTRPLLNRADRDAAMLELYNSRIPVYTDVADLIVKNDFNLPAVEIAEDIASRLGLG